MMARHQPTAIIHIREGKMQVSMVNEIEGLTEIFLIYMKGAAGSEGTYKVLGVAVTNGNGKVASKAKWRRLAVSAKATGIKFLDSSSLEQAEPGKLGIRVSSWSTWGIAHAAVNVNAVTFLLRTCL